MAHMIPAGAGARRQRMQPDERRAQILDAARGQFSERSYTTVSTAEIAAAAGVGRSLVHHYFGGARQVVRGRRGRRGAALADVRTAGPETPLDERLARNVAAGLDVVAANRETWLAVAGHGTALADPGIRELVLAAGERSVERMLAVNRDVVRDTPSPARWCGATRRSPPRPRAAWLAGEQTREATETLLVAAFRDLLLHTIPALSRAPRPPADAGLTSPPAAGRDAGRARRRPAPPARARGSRIRAARTRPRIDRTGRPSTGAGGGRAGEPGATVRGGGGRARRGRGLGRGRGVGGGGGGRVGRSRRPRRRLGLRPGGRRGAHRLRRGGEHRREVGGEPVDEARRDVRDHALAHRRRLAADRTSVLIVPWVALPSRRAATSRRSASAVPCPRASFAFALMHRACAAVVPLDDLHVAAVGHRDRAELDLDARPCRRSRRSARAPARPGRRARRARRRAAPATPRRWSVDHERVVELHAASLSVVGDRLGDRVAARPGCGR